jgi:hypothetical protein
MRRYAISTNLDVAADYQVVAELSYILCFVSRCRVNTATTFVNRDRQMERPPAARFYNLPSMMGYLNDYRPKRGRFRRRMTRYNRRAENKHVKGRYRPARF